ncbi:MAG: hypothetical protein ACOX27_12485 [Caldicoprobacterales bacterium]|jgi:type II secretory pathway pseudopilin PulG
MPYGICGALKRNNGAALIYVIVLLAVIVILSTSVMMLFSSNLRQAKHQERRVEAYYLAYSGIEMAVSALLQKDPQDRTLLDEFKWDPTVNPNIADDLADKPVLTDTLDLGNGVVTITVRAVNNGNRREVRIDTVGALNDSGTSNELTLIFDAENPLIQRWE